MSSLLCHSLLMFTIHSGKMYMLPSFSLWSIALSCSFTDIQYLSNDYSPNLTWRDMQHLVARSSTWNGVSEDVPRVTNGKNFKGTYSLKYSACPKRWISVERKMSRDRLFKPVFH